MIAENILRSLDDVVARLQGQKAATTTLIACPAPTGPISHTGGQTTCYSGSNPPPGATFNLDDANAAIKTFCSNHKHDTLSLPGIEDTVPNGGDQSSSLVLKASIDAEPACLNVDINAHFNFFDCQENMGKSVNDCKIHSQ